MDVRRETVAVRENLRDSWSVGHGHDRGITGGGMHSKPFRGGAEWLVPALREVIGCSHPVEDFASVRFCHEQQP